MLECTLYQYKVSNMILFSHLHAAPYAFITNQGANSVSVIDTQTNEVVKTLNVGHKPAGVAVTSDGKRCFISNPESKTISVIDGKSLDVIAASLHMIYFLLSYFLLFVLSGKIKNL